VGTIRRWTKRESVCVSVLLRCVRVFQSISFRSTRLTCHVWCKRKKKTPPPRSPRHSLAKTPTTQPVFFFFFFPQQHPYDNASLKTNPKEKSSKPGEVGRRGRRLYRGRETVGRNGVWGGEGGGEGWELLVACRLVFFLCSFVFAQSECFSIFFSALFFSSQKNPVKSPLDTLPTIPHNTPSKSRHQTAQNLS